uniref:Uncharacterized protein n=1 Tax=Arundo donax TaxID=35708 RepID=A0A0A9DWX9_ARUDO
MKDKMCLQLVDLIDQSSVRKRQTFFYRNG